MKPEARHLTRTLLLTGLSIGSLAAHAESTDAPAAPAAAEPASDSIGAAAPAEIAPVAAPADGEAQPGESAAEKKAPGTNRFIEEVVVTAQKREEKLQDVPISIAAFSGDSLEARGAVNAADLKFVTPALVYDNLVGYSLIYIRGIGTEVFIPSQEPSVATYIDGIYFPFAHGLAQSFTKLERIEVLKGPQGTLFGRNATGGAINIISKKPTDDFEGDVDLGLTNYDGQSAKAYFSGPLFGGLAYSISGLYQADNPYYTLNDDAITKKLTRNVTNGVNGRLRWQFTDNLSATISAYSIHFGGTSTVVNSETKPTPLGESVGVHQTDPRNASVSEPEDIYINTNVQYGNLEWDTDLADIKLLGSHQTNKTATYWDYDAGPYNAVFFYPTNQYSNPDSAELQFVSNANTPGAEWLEWTAGVFYFQSHAGFDPLFIGVYNTTSPGPYATLVSSLFDNLASLGLPLPQPEGLATLILRGTIQTKSLAEYAQAKWKPLDWFDLTLGGRFQNEKRHVLKSSTGVATDGLDPNSEVQAINFLANKDYRSNLSNFSPRVALDFKFLENTLLYASFSQAEKSGTYNIVAVYTPPTFVKPEKTTSYEMGVKGAFLDHTLQVNAAIFDNEVHDLQTQVVSLAAGGVVTLANAASATIRGAEFDLTWEALPVALPGLVVTASGATLDGHYDSFPQGTGFDPTTGVFFGPGAVSPPKDFSGHRTVRTPRESGSAGLAYSTEVPGGTMELASDVYYNSGYYFDTQNVVKQPQYYTLNARGSYLYKPWDTRISFFAKNLTHQLYYQNIFATDFGQNATAGPPQTWGLTVSKTF